MIDIIKNQQTKTNLCCIKCSKFVDNNNVKIKLEIDGKNDLYSYCMEYGFKVFETIDKRRTKTFIENFEICIKQCYRII